MSFRQFGGLNHYAKQNYVNSNTSVSRFVYEWILITAQVTIKKFELWI
jgi:hypothetical protein